MGMFVVAPSNHHPNHHLSDHPHDHPHSHSLHHTISDTAAATALGVGVGVIPHLTNVATSSNNTNNNNINSIQFWQTPQSFSKKGIVSDHVFGGGGGGGGNGGGGGSVSTSASGSTTTCQDCGNQAKKDCNHQRCRTCCKSRGFDCATHVKSTWVPAARRRERQLVVSSTGGGAAAAGSSASTSGSKKPRLGSRTTTPNSHTSTSRSFGTSSSHHQDAKFMQSLPGQVRAPAVFKCVRVTALEDGDDEYAYQACVTIGGHVFKGFLYDQGLDTRDTRDQTNVPNLSELHLGGGSGSRGRNVSGCLTSPPLNPPAGYGSSGGGMLG